MKRTAIRVWTGIILITILGSVMGAGLALGDTPYKDPQTPPPNPMNVTADLLVLRPVGLIMIPVMGLVYCLSYPFAKMAGNEQETYQSVLGDTIDFTFRRPMGRGEPFD